MRQFRPLALCLGLAAASPAVADMASLPSPVAARKAGMSFLGIVPRILARADTLYIDAYAARWAYDLPEPDALRHDLDQPSPVDDEGWRLALEGQAITAAGSGLTADWALLAELAFGLAAGYADAEGRAVAPDPFASEALAEIAAGAALNAFLLAETDAEAVTALALLHAGLEAGPDPDDAFHVAKYAGRRYPDLQRHALPIDATSFHDAVETTDYEPEEPPPQRDRAIAESAGDWRLICSVTLDCTLLTDIAGISVEVSRSAGPGAPVWLGFVLAGPEAPRSEREGAPARPRVALDIDGAPLPGQEAELQFRGDPLAADGWGYHDVAPWSLQPTLDALLAGKVLHVEGPGIARDIPLDGFRQLADRFDEVQGRVDTVTALVARGPSSSLEVRAAPRSSRLAAPVAAFGAAVIPPVPAETVALWRSECPAGRLAAEPVAADGHALPDGTTVHVLPCGIGAKAALQALFWSTGGSAHALSLPPGRNGAPPRLITFTEGALTELGPWAVDSFDAAARPLVLWAELTGRPDAACGSNGYWVWTGSTGFRLAGLFGMRDCHASWRRIPLYTALVDEVLR